MKCKHVSIALMLLLCLGLSVQAQVKAEDVKTFSLKNGMKIMVLEDHSIPNANMYFFYRAGSRNEYPGITGLSHFLEHMMFNGAKKYGPKMFDRTMEGAGGANNAFTNENITTYMNWFPVDSMELIFDLEADRIANLALEEKMVESERGVVLAERITSMENNNKNFLSEQVKSVAFMAHPYRWSVIGYESDIKGWKRSDLVKYFKTYYAPNNVVLVMAGDITLDGVKKLAEKYFAPIPAGPPPRPIHTREPKQLGEKRLLVHRDTASPNLMIAWHVPETRHKDHYALDMLSSILSKGRSSRLYKALVDEKQLAVTVKAVLPRALDPHLFYINAICARGVKDTDLEKAIYEEIEKIKNEGVAKKELEKVKKQKLIAFYRAMETINGKANNIGRYEVFYGGYEKLFKAPQELRKVTVEDIRRVAATYFKTSNRTVGILKKIEEK